jgi:hypothetical protein
MANTSFFAQLLIMMQERLMENVPDIRYSNQDLGQLEAPGDPPVSWPCALIDMSDTQYADLMGGTQEGNVCTVSIRLGFNPYSQTSNLQPQAVREKGLSYYDLEDAIYRCFQGWTGNGMFSPFTRVRAVTEKREEDRFRVRVLIFTTAFEDDGARPAMQKMKPLFNPDVGLA